MLNVDGWLHQALLRSLYELLILVLNLLILSEQTIFEIATVR